MSELTLPEGTFFVNWDGEPHRIGDADCEAGYCMGNPPACQCGGLIHREFGDEDWEGNVWCYQKCDRCGEDYKER